MNNSVSELESVLRAEIEIHDRQFAAVCECFDEIHAIAEQHTSTVRKVAALRAVLDKHHPHYYCEGRLHPEIWFAVLDLWQEKQK